MSRYALRRTLTLCRAAGRSGRRAALLVGVLAVGIGLLVSCDSSVSTNRPLAEKTASPDSATVAHAPMPTGASLPAPGSGPRGTLRSYRAAKGRKNKSGAAPSPYGCYLASRPYSEEVRFRSVYLYFPEKIVEAAGGETTSLIHRLRASRAGTTDTTGVRYAHCTIPKADGSADVAVEQLVRRGEKSAVRGVFDRSEQGAAAKACEIEASACVIVGPWQGSVSIECDEVVPSGCSTGGSGGDFDFGGSGGGTTDPYPDDGVSGGGGGDDSGGGTGEECTAINPEPGSECEPVEPEDPEPVNEQELCQSDPLEDMDIRPTSCGNSIEGGRFGCTRSATDTCGPGDSGFHGGLDLLSERGTNLYAAEGGTVLRIFRRDYGWGTAVLVETNATRDGQPVNVVYAHLSSVDVDRGQTLAAGDKIGQTGISGNGAEDPCNGGPPHLHVETKSVGESQAYNSADYFDPEEFVGTEFNNNGTPVSDNCG